MLIEALNGVGEELVNSTKIARRSEGRRLPESRATSELAVLGSEFRARRTINVYAQSMRKHLKNQLSTCHGNNTCTILLVLTCSQADRGGQQDN